MRPLEPATVALAGATLIESSAGTGKTYTITTLFLRLLLEQRLEVSQILVVTFTRAATAELRDRIRRRLSDAIAAIDAAAGDGAANDAVLTELIAARRAHGTLVEDRAWLAQALRDFDEAAICTIHAFCQRTLTEHAFESQSPFDLSLLEAQAPLLEELATDYWARIAYEASPELLAQLQAARVDPKSLLGLTKKALRDPRMPVLPDAVSPTTASDLLAPFAAARAQAAQLWRDQRARILAELSLPGRLPQGKGRYTPDGIASWLPELNTIADWEPTALPKCAGKLTAHALREATLIKHKASPPQHPFFEAITELCRAADAIVAALQERVLGLRRGLVDYARAQSVARRRDQGVHSFDDLLQALRNALDGPAGDALARRIVARHPAALIDEFQDTDPVQYAIFRRLYATEPARCLFLIGDPKQAIYGFRGADIFAYLDAANTTGEAAYTLDVNYRSDPRLVHAINVLFERAQRPFVFEQIRFSRIRHAEGAREHLAGDAPALQFLFVPADRTQANGHKQAINKGWGDQRLPALIAAEITALLNAGETLDGAPLRPRDIAVLCRTNAQARATRDALAALSVPTVLDGDSSVFESEIAEELLHVLWAVARPADSRKLGAALASSILGVRGEALLRMRDDDAAVELWLDRLARWNQLWHERGLTQMLHTLIDEAGVQTQLLSRLDGERRLTDLLHLGELLHAANVQQHLGPLSLLHWFAQMREDAAQGFAAESAQLRLEHDEQALRLTTVHRSKGLEYPIVFCPFLWSARVDEGKDVCFHDADDQHRAKLDLGSSEHDKHRDAAQREELAENLRLLYVALTRARHRCYVAWGRFNRARSPLGYVLHQGGTPVPELDLVEKRVQTMDDEALRVELRALGAAAGGAIGVRDLSFAPPSRFSSPSEPVRVLAAREAQRVLRAAPRLSSFSRLTASSARRSGAAADDGDGVDHDQATAEAPPPAYAEAVTAAPLVVMHAFPQGPRPGTLLHSVFEHIDFTRADPDELVTEAERWLNAYGQDTALHATALVQGIDAALRTPLDAADPPLTLARIATAQRVNELEFTLCTEQAAARLSPARLADVFERHAAPASAPAYPQRLRDLRALPPSEFLKGFIDSVFRDGERFYIADYKSNWLGKTAADYTSARMVESISEHHYFLQYHLYALALHRYLSVRVADYAYERHFGGVYYLFVRGMAPEHPRGTGVFFDRPPLALLEALAYALGDAEAG